MMAKRHPQRSLFADLTARFFEDGYGQKMIFLCALSVPAVKFSESEFTAQSHRTPRSDPADS
jgi:hypothetical protein